MLTARQNFYEAVKGGNPDRYANSYEALRLCLTPTMIKAGPSPAPGQLNVVNAWGVTNSWPAGLPGGFPVHKPETIVIKDIEHWQDYVHAPSTECSNEEWDMFKAVYDSVDTTQAYKAVFVAPGLFEQCHHLGEIQNTLVNLYEYEDEMHDLIKYLTEYELKVAELVCEKLHPDALFHHDDLGSRTSTFMSPAMFEEFYAPCYHEIYGYYKQHGVELVIHHSDSYAATLVPAMIDMGVDCWQGCMSTNNLPELRKKYEGKFAFMGGFDGADIDTPDWSAEHIKEHVWKYIDEVGSPKGFIPCIAQGGPGSCFDGVYDAIFNAIDDYNVEKLGVNRDEIKRLPLQYEKNGYM